MGAWIMFSDFGDSYSIYRACELVIMKLNICFCSSYSLFVIRQPLISELPALIYFFDITSSLRDTSGAAFINVTHIAGWLNIGGWV